jgi:hypothetical protein
VFPLVAVEVHHDTVKVNEYSIHFLHLSRKPDTPHK